jgi:predicted nucleic-acid-binding Zn-ribbon protein
MSDRDHTCPKCKTSMQEGYVIDYGDTNTRRAASWISGQPERGFLFGLAIKGKQQTTLQAFRCPACSYVELYAP